MGWLLLGSLLRLPAAQAQDLLAEVNGSLALRLETTCRYRQAALLPAVAAADYYLWLGRRMFLVEAPTSLGAQFVREVYALGATPHDTSSISKARYQQSQGLQRAGQVVSYSWLL